MIKAEEIRIGNYLEAFGNPFKVELKHVISVSKGFSIIHSIPLTEETLLKCGFEKSGKNLTWGVFEFVDGVMWLEYNTGYSNLSLSLDHIQSLHQLQNLVSALTGEELTVKL